MYRLLLTWKRCGRSLSESGGPWRGGVRVLCGRPCWPFFRGSRACLHDGGWRVEKFFSFCISIFYLILSVPTAGLTLPVSGYFGLQNYKTNRRLPNIPVKICFTRLLFLIFRPDSCVCARFFVTLQPISQSLVRPGASMLFNSILNLPGMRHLRILRGH